MPTRRIIAALLFTVALLAGPPDAGAAEACNPSASDPARFCVTSSLVATPTTASTAPELVLTVQNTSPSLTTNATWINSAAFNLTDPSVTPQPAVTRSSQLANGLLLTPPGACTNAASYTDCGGGHGDLIASLDIPGGPFPSSGSFGIAKIVNVNPAGAGIYARYDMTVKGCVVVLGSCSSLNDTVHQLVIAEPPAGSAARLTFSFATRLNVPPVEYSMTNFFIDMKGASNQLDGGGSLGQTQTAFTLPSTCGSIVGSTTFTSANGRGVSPSHSIGVTGCSEPPVIDPETPPVTEPDPPTTPDAERKATTTAVTGKAKRKRVKASGQITPAPDAGQVGVELLRKKGKGYVSVASVAADLSSGAFGATFKNPKHTRKCELIATYPGDSALLPSDATAKFRC